MPVSNFSVVILNAESAQLLRQTTVYFSLSESVINALLSAISTTLALRYEEDSVARVLSPLILPSKYPEPLPEPSCGA